MKVYLSTPERVHQVTLEITDDEAREIRKAAARLILGADDPAVGWLYQFWMKFSAVLP